MLLIFNFRPILINIGILTLSFYFVGMSPDLCIDWNSGGIFY